jgi:hypothetical protein
MDVICPPFPTQTANAQRVYNCLRELRDWLLPQVEWANETAKRNGLVPPNRKEYLYVVLPITRDLSSYMTLSVVSMMTSLTHMQQLRAKFDNLLRHTEADPGAWDSDSAVAVRLHMCFVASLVLRLAFLDDEKRQAFLRCGNFEQQAAKVSSTDHWTAQEAELRFWHGTDLLDQS